MAETYNIYDYQKLPLKMVASLCYGLRENSRVKMKLSGQTVPTDIILMASIVDKLSLILWTKTKDAAKGRNKPKMLLDSLNKKDEVEKFNTPEEFELKRKELIQRIERG